MKNDNIEIIYPDKDSMRRVADVLEHSLQEYRIPLKVRQKTGIDSMKDIREKWLIVLCDPDAVTDEKIKERILDYSRKGQYSHILSLLVSGGSKNSFPNELKYEERPDGTIVEHEPLAANISSDTIDQSLRKLKIEKLRLLAPMLGVSFDELNRRREKQLMQTAMIAGAALLVFAAVFLAFAAIRMKTISSRNDSLQSEYCVTEAARLEAESERDEADRQFASLVATSARLALENKDMELALLLSMEVLPGAGEGGDAEAVLAEALNALSGSGYVPVTSGDAYIRDRYTEWNEPEEPKSETFPTYMDMLIPDGYYAGKEDHFTLHNYGNFISEKYGYAYYNGCFDGVNELGEGIGDVWFMRICFADESMEDYYISVEDDLPSPFYPYIEFPDGTFLAVGYKDNHDVIIHFDPVNNVFLNDLSDFLSDNKMRIYEFRSFEGCEYYFGYNAGRLSGQSGVGDTVVFSYDSFEPVIIMEGVASVGMFDNVPYLCTQTPAGMNFYTRDTFECFLSIEDEFTSSGGTPYIYEHPEHGSFLILTKKYNRVFYDFDDGRMIASLNVDGSLAYRRDGSYESWEKPKWIISSEGYYAVAIGSTIELYRIWDGTLYDKIENIGDNASAEMFGAYDPVTGCRSASAVWVGNGIVYEYHETARQVPETLEERLVLATELLNGRTLTEEERKTYGL